MKQFLTLTVKGALMGAANVIPGVSGGTVALLTGIFEPLINAVKSFDLTALKLLFRGKIKDAVQHVHLSFLIPVGIGIVVSILSFARLLEYLFETHALYVWAFFFGLILASVFFVIRKVGRVSTAVIFLFSLGTVLAAGIAFLPPAGENASVPYLFLCGIVAMCSMILPGLSGSYVLLLMGNYQLVMIDSVVHLRLEILLPVAVGAVAGLAVFTRFLSWVFKHFHDQTIALLTGFIFGSLSILWPWKTAIFQTFESAGKVKEKVIGYHYALPDLSIETLIALGVMAAGIVLLTLMEKSAGHRS
ncbi:MAG: DUF368 domain-containing protein [Kiritimatiellales bacterium]